MSLLIYTTRFEFLDGCLKEVLAEETKYPPQRVKARHPWFPEYVATGRLVAAMIGLDHEGLPASRTFLYRESELEPAREKRSTKARVK